jgi:hypothetical protein
VTAVTRAWKREMVNIVGISLELACEIGWANAKTARFTASLCFCAVHT